MKYLLLLSLLFINLDTKPKYYFYYSTEAKKTIRGCQPRALIAGQIVEYTRYEATYVEPEMVWAEYYLGYGEKYDCK